MEQVGGLVDGVGISVQPVQRAVEQHQVVAVLHQGAGGPQHAAAVVAQRGVRQGRPPRGTIPDSPVHASGPLPIDGLFADVVAAEQSDVASPNRVGHQFHELLVVRVFPVGLDDDLGWGPV